MHDLDVTAYEDGKRTLVRTKRCSYQTMGGARKVRPWGVFVLPRRTKKAYVVEQDVQGLIGGPAIWRRIFRLERLGAPEKELAALPARSPKDHYGDERPQDARALPPIESPR